MLIIGLIILFVVILSLRIYWECSLESQEIENINSILIVIKNYVLLYLAMLCIGYPISYQMTLGILILTGFVRSIFKR